MYKETTSGDVVIKTTITDTLTTVEVTKLDEYGGQLITARGYAKCNPSDYFDPGVGEMIALGRAFSKFGKKLTKYGESISETPTQRRGRLKVKLRTYLSGALIEKLVYAPMKKSKRAQEELETTETTVV